MRRVIGYVYVDGDDLQERKAEIRAWCERHECALATIVHDAARAGDDRPSLSWALAQIAEARADALVVARRHDLPPRLRRLTEPDRGFVALDLDLEQATEAARTRGGQGGTAVADVPELRERIEAMRAQGMTLQAIADKLNEEGVPTLRGGALWRPSSVQRATGYRRPSAGTRGILLPRTSAPPQLLRTRVSRADA